MIVKRAKHLRCLASEFCIRKTPHNKGRAAGHGGRQKLKHGATEAVGGTYEDNDWRISPHTTIVVTISPSCGACLDCNTAFTALTELLNVSFMTKIVKLVQTFGVALLKISGIILDHEIR